MNLDMTSRVDTPENDDTTATTDEAEEYDTAMIADAAENDTTKRKADTARNHGTALWVDTALNGGSTPMYGTAQNGGMTGMFHAASNDETVSENDTADPRATGSPTVADTLAGDDTARNTELSHTEETEYDATMAKIVEVEDYSLKIRTQQMPGDRNKFLSPLNTARTINKEDIFTLRETFVSSDTFHCLNTGNESTHQPIPKQRSLRNKDFEIGKLSQS